ncbi:MAG: hypothetical protein WBA77_12680 [Microcoleaceae cyanobacterium]
MQETFIDLDELILRCRDKASKKLIQEAVSCYRAGAYRSCIVATWNAIVFDFMHKLRELELFGDKEAKKQLEEFENLRSSKQFRELWQFESNIPERAQKNFELISIVEQSDIERLFEDRSRCAHPSMTSLEEPFEATAELARYHLRSAVTHLLSRPPVQGRTARDRIFQAIQSDYFPKDPELAIKHFEHSPLARARLTLIKDVVIGLTKSLLTDDHSEDERERQFSALIAISSMYHQQTREILNDKLSSIILDKVKDENWNKVIIYLEKITVWDNLSEPCRLKAEAYINQLEIFKDNQSSWKKSFSQEAVSILINASHIEFLRNTLINKLQTVALDQIISFVENYKDETFQEKILIPIFEVKIPHSSLHDLLAAKSKYKSTNEVNPKIIELFDVFISQKLKKEIVTFDLLDIFLIIKRYKDEFSIELIKNDLKNKISEANLEDLLRAKQYYNYKDVEEQNTEVIELIDVSIIQRLKDIHIDDLLEQLSSEKPNSLGGYFLDESNNEIIIPILKSHIPLVIYRFEQSTSWKTAEYNAKLVSKIAEYLEPTQWGKVFYTFCKNNQIYGSWLCEGIFMDLFKESFKINNNIVPDYWLYFRDQLSKLNIASKLNKMIDSYVETFGSSKNHNKSQ